MTGPVTASRRAIAAAAAVLVLATAGGTLVSHELIAGGAAVTASDRYGVLQAQVHARAAPAKVPFLGPFKLGTRDPAVRQLDGALHRLRLRRHAATNVYGKGTASEVAAFQRLVHYRATGRYTLATHLALVKRHGYTAGARRTLLGLAHDRVVVKERRTVLLVTGHAHLVDGCCLPYTQSAARTYFPPWPRLPPDTDCSGYATWVLYQSGAGAAVGYFGPGSTVGWTGTLSLQGKSVAHDGPLAVGDLVFYPSDRAPGRPWGHVAVYIGHGLVSSHGGTGINILPWNYRAVGEVRRYIQ